jgi:2-hydroxy-3-oxopropionate reductase
MEQIAFLGTGLMGNPMATRLVGAGFPVTVWNRTRGKADTVVAAGAKWEDTPSLAVAGANVLITMLTNDKSFDAAAFESGAAKALSRGSVVIDMSTTSPNAARDQAGRLAKLGIDFVDAPVSGGTRGAAAGTLAIMAGGAAEVIARLAPVFKPMGNCRRVGEVGAGQLCKLANQLIVAVTIGAVAEALVLAEKGGVDPAAVREALTGGFADSRILSEHGKRMIARDFTPGGLVTNQLKDLNAASAVADSLGVKLPMLSTVHGLFQSLHDHGGKDLDHSALFLEIERLSARSRT